MSFLHLSKDNPIPREEFGPLPPEVAKDRRKTADEEARRDLTKSYEQLLADSHEEVTDPNRTSDQNLGYSNRRLASIFARSAIEANKSAQESLKLQQEVKDLTVDVKDLTKKLRLYTVILLVFGAIQAFYPIIKSCFDSPKFPPAVSQPAKTP